MNDNEAFAKLVGALRPWHAHLVFVGGWAQRLHRLHPDASRPAYGVVQTPDVDLALATRANLTGNIAAALKGAGFHEEFLGDDAPPVTHYHVGESNQGFYVEFLTPLTGSGTRRNGAPDTTLAVAGVTAQKLRHLELLLVAPWHVTVEPGGDYLVRQPTTLMVANPVAFIVQKLLIRAHRKPHKQAQDALYVHDTVQLFGGNIASLHKLWVDVVRPAIPPKAAATVPELIAAQFGGVNDVIRDAVRIPQDRAITPEAFQAACNIGLREIYGGG